MITKERIEYLLEGADAFLINIPKGFRLNVYASLNEGTR